jgi:DNA-binding NarL/FixJ family response regulator
VEPRWCACFRSLPARRERATSMNKSPASPALSKYKVFLIDDHPIVRQGLALFINREPDLMVCGEADGATSALKAIRDSIPDFVVLDISLDGPDGLELLKTLRAEYPNLPVLILSMHDESTYAERALRAGANGYIMKQEATEKVLTAIRHILGGDVYLSDRLTKRMLQQFVHGSISPRDPLAKLSDRELEVYRLIGAGHGTRQIADELHVSTKTVESYQAHIKEKLSLRNARELVQHAIESSVNQKGA